MLPIWTFVVQYKYNISKSASALKLPVNPFILYGKEWFRNLNGMVLENGFFSGMVNESYLESLMNRFLTN